MYPLDPDTYSCSECVLDTDCPYGDMKCSNGVCLPNMDFNACTDDSECFGGGTYSLSI
jgi:hypothetical protein